MQMICPQCSTSITDDDIGCFCPECGCELAAETPAEAPSARETAETQPEQTPAAAIEPPTIEASFVKKFSPADWLQTFTGSLRGIGQNLAENIDQFDIPTHAGSSCDALELAYNRNLFFLSGTESIMKLRLKPLSDQLQHIVVFMEVSRSSGETTRRQVPVREVLKQNKEFMLSIPFNPEQTKGRLSASFYIGCKVGSEDFEYYEFTVEHKVYDDKQSNTSLSITINQDITATHAADVNNRIVSEELSRMAGQDMSVNAIIDRLNDLPPDFQVQHLEKTTWRPGLGEGLHYYADRLLLEWNGKKIYLFNKQHLTVGRAYADLWIPDSTVSKKHADIVYDETSLKLIDHSTYGTYINGVKNLNAEVNLENSALVEFGDVCMKMHIQMCRGRLQHNICQTCNAQKIKSMTFAWQGRPEYYLLVWECCELGRVIEELSDWTVFSRQGSFLIRTPSQDFYFLRPGNSIEANGRKITVKYHPQEQ